MKKIFSALLALTMVGSVLVGCSTTKTDETIETAKTDEKTEISDTNNEKSEEVGTDEVKTLTVMMSSGDSGPGNIKKALEKTAEIMGVTLTYDVIPDDQMLNVANTRLITGNAADLIVHNFGLTDVSASNLAPLDGEWTEKITSTTYPLCIDESGEILKAPLGGESNMGLIYNKEVLEESGVELPIRDYSEFIAACEQIQAAGYTPVYISNKEVWTAQILLLTTMTSVFADDQELIDQIITNEIKPSEVPELISLWENVLSLKTLGFINGDYMSATNEMGLEAIANGECAFYASLDSAWGTLQEFYPESVENLGMMYTPLWDDFEKGYVLFGTATNYLSVAADSENVELAKEFVNTMLSEEPLTLYYELIPGAVPYNDLGFELNMSPFNAEMKEYAKEMRSLGDFNNSTYNGSTPLEPFYGKFNEQVQALFSGLTVEQALERWYDTYAADAQARRVDGF